MKNYFLLLLACCTSLSMFAQPTTITYQGKLLDADGNAITNPAVAMNFAIYDASTNGNLLWPASGSVAKTVDVSQGLYSVQLATGSGDDIAFTAAMFAGKTPWLEVKIGAETLPRTPITNVPFALISNNLSATAWESPGELGKTTPNTGKFTTVETSSNATINGDLFVNGASNKGPVSAGNATITGNLNVGIAGKFNGTEGNGNFTGNLTAQDATIANKITAIDIETNGSVIIESVPSDNSASGLTSLVTVDANDLGFGAALFVAPDGNYELANATDSTRMPCVALAVETGTGVKEIIHQGYVRNDSWDWTVGKIIYISTTDGVITQTFPTETNNQVQIVGYATHPDRIFFNPNFMLIELK